MQRHHVTDFHNISKADHPGGRCIGVDNVGNRLANLGPPYRAGRLGRRRAAAVRRTLPGDGRFRRVWLIGARARLVRVGGRGHFGVQPRFDIGHSLRDVLAELGVRELVE